MLPLASEKKKIDSVSSNQPIKSLDKAILGSIATEKNTKIIHLNIYKSVSCLMFRKIELPRKVHKEAIKLFWYFNHFSNNYFIVFLLQTDYIYI